MKIYASGGGHCGIFGFLSGGATLGFGRRAVVQPGNGAIFAGFFKFKPDEPVRGDNLARSLFVQPKHAQDKSRGLRQRFRRAFGVVAISGVGN